VDEDDVQGFMDRTQFSDGFLLTRVTAFCMFEYTDRPEEEEEEEGEPEKGKGKEKEKEKRKKNKKNKNKNKNKNKGPEEGMEEEEEGSFQNPPFLRFWNATAHANESVVHPQYLISQPSLAEDLRQTMHRFLFQKFEATQPPVSVLTRVRCSETELLNCLKRSHATASFLWRNQMGLVDPLLLIREPLEHHHHNNNGQDDSGWTLAHTLCCSIQSRTRQIMGHLEPNHYDFSSEEQIRIVTIPRLLNEAKIYSATESMLDRNPPFEAYARPLDADKWINLLMGLCCDDRVDSQLLEDMCRTCFYRERQHQTVSQILGSISLMVEMGELAKNRARELCYRSFVVYEIHRTLVTAMQQQCATEELNKVWKKNRSALARRVCESAERMEELMNALVDCASQSEVEAEVAELEVEEKREKLMAEFRLLKSK
jgi:hypothetical protein